MSWSVRVLTAPSSDTDLSLLIAFEHAKYLFNCGEATQRGFVQKRISLKKLDGIFMTGGGLDVVGGLPGILMSAADAGITKVHIGGPDHVAQYLASCRTFVQRDNFEVSLLPKPTSPSPYFSSKSLAIHSIPLSSSPKEHQPSSPRSPGSSSPVNFQNPSLKLRNLTDEHLDQWRRFIVADMFKPPGTKSSRPVLIPTAPTSSTPSAPPPPARPARPMPTPSRMYFPQNIPLRGSDIPPLSHPSDDRFAYILQAPQVRGKFDNEKAKALGVPNGPLRGLLTKGEVIEFPDGQGGTRVVRPEDVMGQGHDGGACIIVDITLIHLPDLLAASAFLPYQPERAGDLAREAKSPHLVVHRVTREVLLDSRYQEWMRSFGSTTNHWISCPDAAPDDPISTDCVTFGSSAWNLMRLNLLDPSMFPLVHQPSNAPLALEPLGTNIIQAVSYLKANIYPPSTPVKLQNVPADPAYPADRESSLQARVALEAELPKYMELLRIAQGKVAEEQVVRGDMGGHYGIVVTPLGTGSAIPSKYRNVSSTLIDIPEWGSILLDAGEGTLGQLRRRYGRDNLQKEVYSRLRIIYISHMHADHHIGLRSILEDRLKHNPQETLYVIAPFFISHHLLENGIRLGAKYGNTRYIDSFHIGTEGYSADVPEAVGSWSSVLDLGRIGETVVGALEDAAAKSDDGKVSQKEKYTTIATTCKSELSLTHLSAPEVTHRGRAYGLVLAHSSGWKIVYSGDTTPCERLVQVGKGATLLVHEATLEDEEAEMAKAKGHSTFGGAIDVGTRMGAKYLLLNHFSQRYPKLPKIQSAPTPSPSSPSIPSSSILSTPSSPTAPTHTLPASAISIPDIALAFDLQTIPLSSFWKMKHYTEAMAELFDEVEKEGSVGVGGGEEELEEFVVNEGDGGGKKGKKGKGKETPAKEVGPVAGKSKGKKGGKTTDGVREVKGAPQARGTKRGSEPDVEGGGESVKKMKVDGAGI